MTVYMIAYNTDDLETNYTGLHSAIKSQGNAVRIMKSTWLIETDKASEELFETCVTYLEKGTHLLVMEMGSEYVGELDKKACDWLKERYAPEPEVKKGFMRRLLFG